MLSKAIIKNIQSLQQKKQRELRQLFIAEGSVVLEEMLAEGIFEVAELYATESWWITVQETVKTRYNNVLVFITEDELQRLSTRSSAHGGMAIFRIPAQPLIRYNIPSLVLASIQDPGNLGTIIRTCDWFGIPQIICSPDTADCHNPKVVQSTMASLGRVQLVYTGLPEFFSKNSLPVYGAMLGAQDLHTVAIQKNCILVLGNEANGISNELMQYITQPVSIAGKGKAESLNVAVAAGILIDRLF